MDCTLPNRCVTFVYLCILLCSHVWSIVVANDLPVNVEVLEESPVGTLINGVAEYLNQIKLNDVKTTDDRDIRYQLLGDDSVSRLLQIHPVHGQLRVASRIDREAICNNQDLKLNQGKKPAFSKDSLYDVKSQYGVGVLTNECVYPLNILLISQPKVNDPQQFESSSTTTRIRINLIIRDINDNAPVWPQHSILQVSFVETPSSAMGWTSLTRPGQSPLAMQDLAAKHAKTLDRAVDLDMGVNGTVVYRLFGPGKEYFHLDDSSQDTVDFLKPNFIHSGSTMRDIGNGFPTMPSTVNEISQPPLRIWPIVPLDRETEEFAGRDGFFNLTLLAHDLGVPRKTGSIVLIITVIDVNDHGPVFHNDMLYNTNSNGIPGSDGLDKPLIIYRPQNGNIRETIPVGSFITQLNATDKDNGIHGEITYEFCPCDRNIAWNYFKIDRHSGRVVVTNRLDYDNGPRQFQFKVIAKDGAPEPYTLTGTAMVDVALTDENDEAPEIHVMLVESGTDDGTTRPNVYQSGATVTDGANSFGMMGAKFGGEFTTSIYENPKPDTVIAYVQVLDRDHNGQDQVHCHLGPTDNFTLQPDSIENKYTSGSRRDPFSSAATLSDALHRQDFRLVTGTSMITFTSSSLSDQLDRESSPSQLATLTCTDSVGNAAYVRIQVQLKDVNDHAPEFSNYGHFVFKLPENQELIDGKPIWLGRTVATDKDFGENAVITYQLDDHEDVTSEGRKVYGDSSSAHLFELDTQTGDLFAKTVFDRESGPLDGVYRFRVYATDKGQPSLTGTATVEVNIMDVNDWAPQFTKDVYSFSVPEDTRVQEVIGSVEAIDRDANSQGKITYHLLAHSNTLKRELDRTKRAHDLARLTPSEYIGNEDNSPGIILNLRVKRQENENNSIPNHRTLDNDTDATPTVTEPHYQAQSYPESFYSDSLQDDSAGNAFRDHLAGQANYFSVDRLSGKIRLIRRLDRESIAFFALEIVATDSPPATLLPSKHSSTAAYKNHTHRNMVAPKMLSATTTVVIAIMDVNDNAPVFRRPNTSTAIQLRVQETLGRQLLVVEATDADEGENARISFFIRNEVPRPSDGPGTGYFAIDETTGTLFLAKTLNSTTTHRLVIEACDHGSGNTRRCTLSPSIRVTVSDGLESPDIGDMAVYQARMTSQSNQASSADLLPFDLDQLAARSAAVAQTGRRNEVVVICLVVLFSILLLATIVLVAWLVNRRGTRSWLMGRSGTVVGGEDSQTVGKDTAKLKSHSNNDPWSEEAMNREQTEMVLDPKFDPCKLPQYDVNYLPKERKYLSHGNMLATDVYAMQAQAAYGRNANKFMSDSQPIHLSGQYNHPSSFIHLSPTGRHLVNNLSPVRSQVPELNELLTQSSYKPPSPDYQSLDVIWQQCPRNELGFVNHIHRYQNPILSQESMRSYAVAQSVQPNTENAIFLNAPPPNKQQTGIPHTYYEITENREKWQSPDRVPITEDDGSEDKVTKPYSGALTLGRPTTGKGKRRLARKEDSIHNLRAGELALHSAKRTTNKRKLIDDVEQVSESKDDDATYETKPKPKYAYQAYREGTFV